MNADTSAFISYARKDRDFVERLHGALTARGKTGWVDWEGIPPSAAWREEIHASIDAAQAFIFVLSPDSVKSQVCAEEVAHAQARGKRLIPVVCRDVEAGVPDSLARLNWVLLRPQDDFDRGVNALVKAIDTDLDWVRLHTRLLVRAQRWSEEAKDRSALLRGQELKEAEDWLFGDQKDANTVTQLHRNYIRASRESAQRTLRTILATTAGALAVMFVLAVLAWTARNTASANTSTTSVALVVMTVLAVLAWRERNTARSRELAALARERVADEPELAALLAREALKASLTPQADLALRLATFELRRQRWVAKGVELAESIDFIDGGARVRLKTFKATSIWDAATGAAVPDVPAGAAQTLEPASGPHRGMARDPAAWPCKFHDSEKARPVGYAPNGAFLVVVHDDVVRLWDPTNCQSVMAFEGHSSIIYSVDFSPDGARLVTGSNDNTARIWDVSTGRTIAVLRGHTGAVTRALFDSFGQHVATVSDDYSIRIWRSDTGEPLARLRGHREGATEICFSPNGQQLVSVGRDGTLRSWNVTIPPFERVLLGHQDFVTSISFSPDCRRVLTTSSDKTARLWEVETGAAVATLDGHTDFLGESTYNPDGSLVATGGREKRVRLWNAGNGTLLGELPSHGAGPEPLGGGALVFSGDGSRLLAMWDHDAMQIWDVNQHSLLHEQPGVEDLWQVHGVGHTTDGTRIAVATGGPRGVAGTLRIFDILDGKQLLEVIRLEEATVPKLPCFSPDGKLLALTTGFDDIVRLYSAATGTLQRTFKVNSDQVNDLTFSPNGQYLLLTSRNGASSLRSVATGSEKARIKEDAERSRGARFHPEGHVIVTFDDAGFVRAWRASDGRFIRVVSETRFPGISNVAFSRDGQWLGVASCDRTARVYPIEAFLPIDDVQALLGRRLSRGLTEDERRVHLHELIPRVRAWWWRLITIKWGS